MKLHRNARTTPHTRLVLVERIGSGVSFGATAEAVDVSRSTAHKWWEEGGLDSRSQSAVPSLRTRFDARRRPAPTRGKLLSKSSGNNPQEKAKRTDTRRGRPQGVPGLPLLQGEQLIRSLNVLSQGEITALLRKVGYSLPAPKKATPSQQEIEDTVREEVRRLLHDPTATSFLKSEIEAAARDLTSEADGLAAAKRDALGREVDRWLKSPRGAMQLHHLKTQAIVSELMKRPQELRSWVSERLRECDYGEEA